MVQIPSSRTQSPADMKGPVPLHSEEDRASPLSKMRGDRNNHGEASYKGRAAPAIAKASVAAPGLANKLRSLLRRCDTLVCMAWFGAFAMLASVAFGVALQRNFGAERSGDFIGVRTIPVDLAAYSIEPWNMRNCNMVLGDELLVIFVMRRYVFEGLANRFYSHLPANKRAKIGNYMLELLIMNMAVAIAVWCGFFRLLVAPSSFHHPTAVQGDRFFIGAQQTVNLFIATYVIEMCVDNNVRTGLVMHHWAVFLLCVWGTAALYALGYDILMTRTFFCLSLYISSEQNVFIEMLLYQQKIYMPRLFLCSAWYYLLTRIVIAVYCIICWLDMFDEVFHDDYNSWISYSMWAAVPIINLILNATQMTTVISLFGIARETKRRCNRMPAVDESSATKHQNRNRALKTPGPAVRKERSTNSLRSSVSTSATSSRLAPVEELELPIVACGGGRCLLEVFAEVDASQRGTILLADWLQYVANLWSVDSSIPLRTYEDIFDEMRDLCCRSTGVTVDAFISYFDQYLLEDTDFDLILSALALQKAHAAAEGDATLRTVLCKKHATVMQRLLRQHRERRPSVGSETFSVQAAISDASTLSSAGGDLLFSEVLTMGDEENCLDFDFEDTYVFGPLSKLSLNASQQFPARRRAKRTSKTWMGPATVPLELAE